MISNKRYRVRWGFESKVVVGERYDAEAELDEEEAMRFVFSMVRSGVKVEVDGVSSATEQQEGSPRECLNCHGKGYAGLVFIKGEYVKWPCNWCEGTGHVAVEVEEVEP